MPQAIMKHLVVWSVAAVFLAACAARPKSGEVLLVDDFSNPDSGFNRQADADTITDYVGGEYKIEVFTPDLYVWSLAGPSFGDAVVEANARTAGGTENNLYGLICRRRDDDNFYFFSISADGYYAIGKLKDGQVTLLSSQVFEYSDKILTGPAANHIAATCAAQTLTLTVNGFKLSEVADADFSGGQVGLIALTFEDTSTDVRFDNLLVTGP